MNGVPPIVAIVDQACGFDRNNPPPPAPKPDFEAIGKAMVEVCEAARRWDRNHKKGTPRLRTSLKTLRGLGW